MKREADFSRARQAAHFCAAIRCNEANPAGRLAEGRSIAAIHGALRRIEIHRFFVASEVVFG
jgi:hypothetical protein